MAPIVDISGNPISSQPSFDPKPRFRMVDVFPVQTENGEGICIRDPNKIAPNALVLPPAAYLLVTMLDGEHTLSEIHHAFSRQLGQEIARETIEQIIRQLDEELFMEGERFEQAYAAIQEEFKNSPIRPAAHAGGAYEEDPAKLQGQLQGLMAEIERSPGPEPVPENGRLSLLVSPHIDLHRGGPGFARAYREIQSREPSDLYVILGTGHQCRKSLLACTRKDYSTPLGLMKTDVDFIEQFASESPLELFDEEFLHRDEHSIEFQAVFLRYALGPEWDGRMVPILCGSFHPFVAHGVSPREEPALADSLDLLRGMIESHPGNVTVIAGVDLSHVGKRFGHREGIPPEELERVDREDQAVLRAMKSGDAETFYQSVAKDKDKNNVCGLSPVYMCLDIIRPGGGVLLHYGKAVEEDTDSVVTFASMAFYQ